MCKKVVWNDVNKRVSSATEAATTARPMTTTTVIVRIGLAKLINIDTLFWRDFHAPARLIMCVKFKTKLQFQDNKNESQMSTQGSTLCHEHKHCQKLARISCGACGKLAVQMTIWLNWFLFLQNIYTVYAHTNANMCKPNDISKM